MATIISEHHTCPCLSLEFTLCFLFLAVSWSSLACSFVKLIRMFNTSDLVTGGSAFQEDTDLDITLVTAYFNFVNRIALGLGVTFDEDEIRQAFAAFWSFQLAGLAGLKAWVQR